MVRLVRQLAANALLLAALFTLTFAAVELLPGDAALVRAGERADAATLEKVRHEFGLDRPLVERFAIQAVRLLFLGDPGTSRRTRRPVREDLADALPATLELASAALLIAVLLGVPLGVWAARRRGSWPDVLVSQGALLGVSIPVFVLGYLMILGFGGEGGLSFAGRLGAARVGEVDRAFVLWGSLLAGDWQVALEALNHLALPALTLATIPLAIILRLTRSAVLEQLNEDWLRTARAKGVSEVALMLRHALPVAAPAIVTVIALQTGLLMSGAVLTEGIFSWPGMGRYLIESLRSQDAPALQGCILLFGVIYLGVHLLSDLACAILDPRWRDA